MDIDKGRLETRPRTVRLLLAAAIGASVELSVFTLSAIGLALFSLGSSTKRWTLPDDWQLGPSFSAPTVFASVAVLVLLLWPLAWLANLGLELAVFAIVGPKWRRPMPWLAAGAGIGMAEALVLHVVRGERLDSAAAAFIVTLAVAQAVAGVAMFGVVQRSKSSSLDER